METSNQRDYTKEKQQVYDTMVAIVDARPKRQKSNRIQLQELVDASGLEKIAVANALKWLKRKVLAATSGGKDGWLLVRIRKLQYAKYCWRHGLVMTVEGRGKKRKVFCPICERRPEDKREE